MASLEEKEAKEMEHALLLVLSSISERVRFRESRETRGQSP